MVGAKLSALGLGLEQIKTVDVLMYLCRSVRVLRSSSSAFRWGVALSCSCVSGVVFSLLDLFLGVGFAGLGRTGEEDFFLRFWERGRGLGL